MCDGRFFATLPGTRRLPGAGPKEDAMAGAIGYEVRIRILGELDPALWGAQFDGLVVNPEPDGTTLIAGTVVDQAAVHGLVGAIRDLGLSLLFVELTAHRGRAEAIVRGDRHP
jgi:hypothetical protein